MAKPYVLLMLFAFLFRAVDAILNTIACCEKADAARDLFDQHHVRLDVPYLACDWHFVNATTPAVQVFIPYEICAATCEGGSSSDYGDATAWMAPLAQFLLPSIIFSMGIPRRRLFVPTWTLGQGRLSFVTSPLLLLLRTIDLALWVAVIFATAGPLMISALTETILDINVFSVLSSRKYSNLSSASRVRLSLAITSGKLRQQIGSDTGPHCPLAGSDDSSVEPLFELSEAIDHLDRDHQPQKLLDLMNAQTDWATIVGYPVLFYIVGFVCASLDLEDAPPSADAPLALTFGVKWMIVVHVAIVSGCLLSNNNPSTASALVRGSLVPETRAALPNVYTSRYQPVSIWSRDSNKQIWLDQITLHCDNDGSGQPTVTPCRNRQEHAMLKAICQDLKIGIRQYLFAILLPALTLTTLPSIAGAYLTYQTAPKGFGCLSLTLACYAGSQILVIFLHELRRHASSFRTHRTSPPAAPAKHRFIARLWFSVKYAVRRVYYAMLLPLYLITCLISLLVALGEPTMSAAGIYSDCKCFVNVNMWLHLDRAFVPVTFAYDSSPTSYGGWVIMGYVAASFMVLCTYASWYYQHIMKERYRTVVRAL
nr:hypothetical protein B0A51_10551 [Rachicladosporium sp. CCFEE 5018]